MKRGFVEPSSQWSERLFLSNVVVRCLDYGMAYEVANCHLSATHDMASPRGGVRTHRWLSISRATPPAQEKCVLRA